MAEKNSFDVNDWGGYAACYDSLNYLSPYQELQKIVANEVDMDAGNYILDAACGTGNLIRLLIEKNRNNKNRIWGIDFSEEMLKRARKKCIDMSVCFSLTDLSKSLDFGDYFFDTIVSVNTLYSLENPENTLKEFARIMRQDGQLVLVTPKKNHQNGLILKEHCKSVKPDSYWMDIFSTPEKGLMLLNEAIQSPEIRQQMISIGEYNRGINSETNFHFFENADLLIMVRRCNFKIIKVDSVYAKQATLVVARKEV